jgi:beta-N-acetylhexosaminidase
VARAIPAEARALASVSSDSGAQPFLAEAPQPPQSTSETVTPLVPVSQLDEDIDALVDRMSLEDKVGQLMMVGFGGTVVDDSVRELLNQKRVGGVCLFGRNIQSAAQISKLNDDLQSAVTQGIPLFIAVDQEGGNVVRVDDGNVVLPGNMALGATRDSALAFAAGKAQGLDLRRLGFNMNLAPVLDVNSNPRNPVIGVRAFGDNVKLVSELGNAFILGQQTANIATVAKHFPGHGSVDSDSHAALPIARGNASALRAQLAPFEAAAKIGLDGMMTAHIATPALSGDELPATLSPTVLGHILRKELKFDGLVLTDELEMDAIDARYGVGTAAVMAINAGADMVLIPWRKEKKTEVWEALLQAARNQSISKVRLDEAVHRIVRLKTRRGVFEPQVPREQRLLELGKERVVADDIAKAAVTLLKTDADVFPLGRDKMVVVISAENKFTAELAKLGTLSGTLVVPTFPSDKQREPLKRAAAALAAKSDVAIVSVHNSRHVELVTNAKLAGKKVVAVLFGQPYLATMVHDADVILATYSYRPAAMRAVAGVLYGKATATGVLPVNMSLPKTGAGSKKHMGAVP